MRIQSSRRGFFYRCDDCTYTINNFGAQQSTEEFEPVILKFKKASRLVV